jgi:ActR/RegA family two-component response regulator
MQEEIGQITLNDLFQNVWLITIVGGAIAALLGAILIKIIFPKKTQGNPTKAVVKNIINIHDLINRNKGISSKKIIVPNEIGFYKENIKILFIDDLDIRDKTNNLMRAGWKNVTQITSADDLDQQTIKEADIIFIDYLGIAKSSKDQGIALVSALRERYKDTKWLILFSAHNLPIKAYNNNKKADSYLEKNASMYEIEQKIIEGLEALHK